jgi:hypothetical protein
VKDKGVEHSRAYEVSSYRQLVEKVAQLAYINSDHLLFFRGQGKDYQSKAGGTTLYPAIYRGDNVPRRELAYRFEQLDQAARVLVDLFSKEGVQGHRDISRKRYVQWSILQHYSVVPTPLLDLTHSLRVACSFAQLESTDPICYVYVLGLPYLTNRISIDSEDDLVNVRLLSICPPAALRPYFQEGYMAGTPDVTTNFDSKTEVDFRNRLIAKFAIPRTKRFWGTGFELIPRSALLPSGDRIEELCSRVRAQVPDELQPGDLGVFVREWADLEEILTARARQTTERNLSLREAISALVRSEQLSPSHASALDSLRRFRNVAVHQPREITPEALSDAIQRVRALRAAIPIDAAP